MGVTVRPCVLADAEALALVAQATFLDAYADMLDGADILAHCRTQLSERAHKRWLRERDSRLWLAHAEPGDAPIGYAGLARPDLPVPTDAADIELKRFYALSRWHGTGVADDLMRAATDEARRMGRRRVLLGVNVGNARAIAYYRKAGFAEVGTRKFTVGATTHDDLVMARILD